jgi:hypothetical protein
MSSQNYVQQIAAGATITLPNGRFFMLRTASSNVDVETQGNPGAPVRLIGIGAGSRFGPVAEGQGWSSLRITSALAQTVEVIISDDGLFDVANTVSVAGAVQTQEQPAGAMADTADTAILAGATANIAANLARRRITIGVVSTAASPVRVSQAGTAGRGIEIQPGTYQEFKNTAALVVRNDTATNTSWYAEEET